MGKQTNYRAMMNLMALIFFMMGALTCLNDLLVPNLKAKFNLDYTQALLVQFCFFLTYALMSIPISRLGRWLGYKRGLLVGLFLCMLGCIFFILAASFVYYALFLLGLFILASGVVCLQVLANPLVSLLGASTTASSRLTFVQALNSLGTTLVPLILGGAIISGALKSSYSGIIVLLLIFMVFVAVTRFPTFQDVESANVDKGDESLWRNPRVIFGAMAIFIYVGVEVSASSLIVNYLHLPAIANMPKINAAHYLSFFWGGALLGRFVGAALLRRYNPAKLVRNYALVNSILVLISVLAHGYLSMWCILSLGLFNSIMFPTIFSLALEGAGKLKSRVSGILCTAIVGGAIIPLCQGWAADKAGLQNSFILLIGFYLALAIYAIWVGKHK